MWNMNEQTVEREGNGLKKTMGPAYLFTMAVATIIRTMACDDQLVVIFDQAINFPIICDRLV